MSSKEQFFAVHLVKAAAEKSRKSYLGQVAAIAPAAAISSASDFPKGYIEESVSKALGGVGKSSKKFKTTIPKSVASSLKLPKVPKGGFPKSNLPSARSKAIRRGIGRAGGRMVASLATTPMFLSGIKGIATGKTREEKRKGAVKVLAAGAAFAAVKGGIEGRVVHGSPFAKDRFGEPTKKALESWKKIKGLATVRGAIGTAAAASTAAALAKTIKGKKKKETFKDKFVVPSLIGAGVGGLKGGVEGAYMAYTAPKVEGLSISKKLKNITPKKIISAAGGKAAAGAIGAVVLSEITKKFMNKVSSVNPSMLVAGTHIGSRLTNKLHSQNTIVSPAGLYSQTSMWANENSEDDVRAKYRVLAQKDPERTPASRSVFYALHDNLRQRGNKLPPTRMRERVHPPQNTGNIGVAMGILATSMAPHALEAAVDSLPKPSVDRLMSDALDTMIAQKGFHIDVSSQKRPSTINLKTKQVKLDLRSGSAVRAHELGHITSNKIRKELLQSIDSIKAHKAGGLLATVLPVFAVAISADPSFATKEELMDRANLAKAVGTVSGAMMAPRLAEEGLATYKGLGHTRHAARRVSADVNKASIHYLKRMLPKLSGYAAPLIVPYLAAKYFENKARNK